MPKKVLIVEDNELNMKLFADLLEAHGYETRQTREGLTGCRCDSLCHEGRREAYPRWRVFRLYRKTDYGDLIFRDSSQIRRSCLKAARRVRPHISCR